jgi:hypothetical protein
MSQEMMSKEKFMSEMRIKHCVLASSWELSETSRPK